MANNKLFIPNKIKVGYQHRLDTYTNRLAYVIYYDSKGKLCKETSWRGWIHDQEVFRGVNSNHFFKPYHNDPERYRKDPVYVSYPAIEPDDFENVPVSGFVLNKKAGGYSTGWNHRQMKCRVFDPRGFEFEIGIDNLLFILQESNSYKGKGLEGEFIYAWAGKDIILLPVSCEDYKSSRDFTDMKTMKVSAKSLVEGYTYTNKNTNHQIYLGKFDYITYTAYRKEFGISKEYMFFDITENKFLPVKPTNIARIVDSSVTKDFADYIEKLQDSGLIKPFEVLIEDLSVVIEPLYSKTYHEISSYDYYSDAKDMFIDHGNDTYTHIQVLLGFNDDNDYPYYSRNSRMYGVDSPNYKEPTKKFDVPVSDCQLVYGNRYKIVDGEITYVKYDDGKKWHYTRTEVAEVRAMKFKTINLKFSGGHTVNLI